MPIRKRHAGTVIALVIVVGIIIAVGMVRRGFSARAEPSAIEALIARTMRAWAIPSKAKNMKNPLPVTPQNLGAGLEHFADHCATCHANNGSGDTLFGRGLYPKPPDMRTGHTQAMTDGEIYYTIQNGIRLTGMPAFGDQPSENDEGTWQLVHFIRHLPKLTPEEEQRMTQWNPRSVEEVREEMAEQEFLNTGEAPKGSQTHKH
jgi:mono/diheme cytochrome c family protein